MSQQFFTWGGDQRHGLALGRARPTVTAPTWSSTAALFVLNVTAAAAAVAGDTLDVWVQHSWDDGATRSSTTSSHFTQVLGNGGAKRFFGYWILYGGSPSTPMKAPQDGALTAGQVQQGLPLRRRGG
jgi:hypothetical protein